MGCDPIEAKPHPVEDLNTKSVHEIAPAPQANVDTSSLEAPLDAQRHRMMWVDEAK
jgi:hypothetical protein